MTIAADAIICLDAEQRITFFNDGAAAIFGYTADEVVGRPLDMLLPERFRAAHGSHVRRFGEAAEVARTMGERRQISGVRKDGTEFPAEAAIAHIASAEGEAFSVVLRDITERRRVEALNAQLVVDLRAAVRARDEMLGVVSHDLRNPVNAVKMLSAAILRSGEHAPTREEVIGHAGVMRRAADQMDTLIQDLLDVTRIESGRLVLTPQIMQLNDVVSAVLGTLGPLAAQEGVTLDYAPAQGLPGIEVDSDRIEQVLSNLVSNAVKHSVKGGNVVISARAEDDNVRVSVVDAGAGIAAEDLPRVFDRFWQSKRTNRSGAGLGLTIARGIVRAHGGRIWIESELGKGTSVHFTLPAASGA